MNVATNHFMANSGLSKQAVALATVVLLNGVFGLNQSHADGIATLRQGHEIGSEQQAPSNFKVENDDIKRKRNYPMQPPTIPHHIDNYQVDLRSNKCLSCHSRDRTEETQAPMISVTHYMDRDGNFLADVSPRRYFCGQCHVVQHDTKPLIDNDFKDISDLIKSGS